MVLSQHYPHRRILIIILEISLISCSYPGHRFHLRPGRGRGPPQSEVPERGEGVHQHGHQQGRRGEPGGVPGVLQQLQQGPAEPGSPPINPVQ